MNVKLIYQPKDDDDIFTRADSDDILTLFAEVYFKKIDREEELRKPADHRIKEILDKDEKKREKEET